jgi:hypothetical protein
MIAALIFVVSAAALLQFFVSYCRSLIAAYGQVELSEQTREVAGIDDHIVYGDDFHRLLQLVGLCPEPGDDRMEIWSVRTYYRLLDALRAAFRPLMPGISEWAERERISCSYFAAVTLDRRITYNRDLMAQQMSHKGWGGPTLPLILT